MADQQTESVRRDKALAAYLDSMDKAGGGVYTADFRSGFRHALDMVAAYEKDEPRPEMLTPWYVLRRVAQTMPHYPEAVRWLHVQADGWEASGVMAAPVETGLRGDPRTCADGHRDVEGCVRRWATREGDDGFCECAYTPAPECAPERGVCVLGRHHVTCPVWTAPTKEVGRG